MNVTRRRFLEDSLLATTAALGAVPALGGEGPPAGASERIRAAATGMGGRGTTLALELVRFGAEVVTVCDPDSARGAAAADRIATAQGGRKPAVVRDVRRIADDKSIDVVSCASCNHWHALIAIWAMQAGKHVYVEKPVSHNLSEGRRMVQAARKHGRICQGGTQRRSWAHLRQAAQYMAEGKLGKVSLARVIVYGPRKSIGPRCKGVVPATVDYNLWAGPAPLEPPTRRQFHYDWHWFWDTGSGEIGNNGIHMVDAARLGLGLTGLGRGTMSYGARLGWNDAGETPNTHVAVHDFGETTVVQEIRNLPNKGYAKPGGTIFEGSEGTLCVGKGSAVYDPKGKLVKRFTETGEHHMANFLRAVREGKREILNAEILEGHQSTALCHLANISYRLGRPATPAAIRKRLEGMAQPEARLETFERVKQYLADNQIDIGKSQLTLGASLEVDSERERLIGNAAANAFLTRQYRKPFAVPSEKDI